MRSRTLRAAALQVALMLALGACSDGGPSSDGGLGDGSVDAGPCLLKISRINGADASKVTKLTADDDLDATTLGYQVDIEVTTVNLGQGANVSLDVTALPSRPVAEAIAGVALFKGVTVSASLTSVAIRALADQCAEDLRLIVVDPTPECFFVQPVDGGDDPRSVPGASLSSADDKNPANQTFDYDVVVGATNAVGGSVILRVEGVAKRPAAVGPDGRATFSDTVLPGGDQVQLTAELTVGELKRSCKATIAVTTELPTCNISFVPSFVPALDGRNGLGIDQDTDPVEAGIQTTIDVETSAGVTQVALLVDGVRVETVDVVDNKATFANRTLADTPAGTLRHVQVSCEDTISGNSALSQPVDLEVDSVPPPDVTALQCFPEVRRAGEIGCSWNSVGQEAQGVAQYTVKYVLDKPLDESGWDAATLFEAVTNVVPAGEAQDAHRTGLEFVHSYSLGVRARDNVGNDSALAVSDPVNLDYIEQARQPVEASQSGWGLVMTAGDFLGCDAKADLAIGDPAANSNKGRVYIYRGTGAGYPDAPEKIINGTEAEGGFGAGLATLPNFDGDMAGCADLAVYASHEANPAEAKVFVYLGRSSFGNRTDLATGTGAELVLKLPSGANAGDTIGEALASAGTFNGDGLTDLALSYRQPGSDAANVLVVFGSALTPLGPADDPVQIELPAAADVGVAGGKLSERFGEALCGGVSLDDDTFADLVIGAPATEVGGAQRGKVYVVKGAEVSETIGLSHPRVLGIAGGTDNTTFGERVAVVGDMDNDGWAEFAVADTSVSGSGGSGANAGKVYVFSLGGGSPPATVSDAVFTVSNDLGGAASDRLGTAIACAGTLGRRGDVDNDGFADLLVSAEQAGAGQGVAYLFRGGDVLGDRVTSAPSHLFQAPLTSDDGSTPLTWIAYGASLRWIPDVDGDGYVDLVVGDPLANSADGRIVIFY